MIENDMSKAIKVVFTDLDGTLLDHHTYSYEKSLPGINLLKRNDIPLVLVSSKTKPEMDMLHKELQLDSPFIFENGAGISYPMDNGSRNKIEINGKSIEELTESIDLLKKILNLNIKTILEMEIDEIVSFTGLSPEKARYSTMRVASLPFVLLEKPGIDLKRMDDINSELNKSDLRITKGGRFYHFSSINANKGYAVSKILDYFISMNQADHIITSCLGDSENDIPMIEKADYPFLVRKHDGSYIDTGNIEARVTAGIGPEGFTEAVNYFVNET